MKKNSQNIEGKSSEGLSAFRLFLFSFIIALFVIYPNLSIVKVERAYLGEAKHAAHLLFFTIRYLYFSALIWILIKYNIQRLKSPALWKRILHALIISVGAFLVYIVISKNLNPKKEWFEGLVVFQFLVMTLVCALIGHVYHLYTEQRKKEQEIEKLKVENLQSRFDALTNQINPHFFFNSLNGLTSLVRKKNDENTLAYVNKLSDVFRYILQSDKKVLVSLEEELEFVQSFRYMMEVRFANKLVFIIDVD
ncbi:MAG: sensor histidine kinase, partial [Chloroflexota bacterium]